MSRGFAAQAPVPRVAPVFQQSARASRRSPDLYTQVDFSGEAAIHESLGRSPSPNFSPIKLGMAAESFVISWCATR